MKAIARSVLAVVASAALSWTPVAGQTYSNCDPLTTGNCPADTALGRSVNIDFTQGASDSFTPQSETISYDSNGVEFTISAQGNAPQITSKWYIMFGHVEVVLKAASGQGIVSSVVMQSDDLDEIDWEWLGGDNTQVQTNYFGKGETTDYNRGTFQSVSDPQGTWHTYAVDWTADQITWSIDGTVVRTLTPATADSGQYPQTPMQIKIGSWAGGDPSNAEGTIEWAGGITTYSDGPFTMTVQSVAVTDYSTGTSYSYDGTSGNWESIQAAGGQVNPSGSAGAASSPTATAASSTVTSSSPNMPYPFSGGSSGSTSTWSTPSEYPWVASTTLTTSSATTVASQYPGLPSGWSVTSSGKVVPPSTAPSTSPPSASSSPSSSSSPPAATPAAFGGEADSGLLTITSYDQQGFPTLVTVPVGYSTMAKSYNEQGFLITSTADRSSATSTPSTLVRVAADSQSSAGTSGATVVRDATATGAASVKKLARGLGAVCGILGGALIL